MPGSKTKQRKRAQGPADRHQVAAMSSRLTDVVRERDRLEQECFRLRRRLACAEASQLTWDDCPNDIVTLTPEALAAEGLDHLVSQPESRS